jgi:hypothetical protein
VEYPAIPIYPKDRKETAEELFLPGFSRTLTKILESRSPRLALAMWVYSSAKHCILKLEIKQQSGMER